MAPPLLLDIENKIATITLNRPDQFNSLSPEMMDLWVDALEACRTDDDVHVIIVTGAGKGFCSGGDVGRLGETTGESPADIKKAFWEGLHRIPKKMAEIDKPVIAAVNGHAFGAGVDAALHCDIRFAAETAKFQITYTMFGLVPGNGGTYYLPRLVGESKALELFWSADLFTAAEALEWGVVNKVFPRDELMERTVEWARKVTERAPLPVRLIKRMVKQGMRMDFTTNLDMISSHMIITRSSEDHKEGIAAYQEGRPPKFKNR